jgi:hypothetical protein
MEHRFIKFEEALDKLGVSADRLNQLREEGELRAYRDGASWKFRADEIEKMADEGVPEPAPPSDIGLVDDDELVDASPLADLPELDDELTLAGDDDDLSLGGSELELELEDGEDTVTAGASDASLKDADEPSDPSDSILLSDETLGESSAAPPSTIIGKSELEAKDADLELVTESDESDVKLSGGASEVLSSHVAGSGVLDDVEKESGHTSAFEGLEELELDLAAESSRILGAEEQDDFAEQVGATSTSQPKGDSDLTLGDVELAGEDEGTDPIPEELAADSGKAKKKDAGPTSDLELATDDDDEFVLAEAGGSDITLDSADSGINLIDPSDSGLALDDIPLEMGGSAILESLSLGGDQGESEISLVGDAPAAPAKPRAKLQTDDDFRLTPLGDREEDGDSSSQVIALDAGLEEELGGGDAGILGEDMFAEETEGVPLTEDYEGEPGTEFGTGYTPAVRSDSDYSTMNIVGLACCMILLLFGVIVMLDMVRNIWSWDQNLALNDSLLDSLLGLFGLS